VAPAVAPEHGEVAHGAPEARLGRAAAASTSSRAISCRRR
jgi:hypothetical protein